MRSYHVMDMIDRLPLGGSLDNANDSCIVPILYLKHCGHQKIIEMRMATATAIDCSWSSQTKWMLRQIGWWISKKITGPYISSKNIILCRVMLACIVLLCILHNYSRKYITVSDWYILFHQPRTKFNSRDFFTKLNIPQIPRNHIPNISRNHIKPYKTI